MSSIPDRRHLEYARGYIELGMVAEATHELEAIASEARMSTEALRVWVDLHMESKQWNQVVAAAKPVCEATPKDFGAWIAWAYALRELQQVKEAQAVLLRAEPLHSTNCAVLHYNLACYEERWGNLTVARQCVQAAIQLNSAIKKNARQDPDLAELWN